MTWPWKKKECEECNKPKPVEKKYRREVELEGIILNDTDTAETVKQKLSKFKIVEGISGNDGDGFFHVYTDHTKIDHYYIWFNGHCKTSKIWGGWIGIVWKKNDNWSENDCESESIPWKEVEITDNDDVLGFI